MVTSASLNSSNQTTIHSNHIASSYGRESNNFQMEYLRDMSFIRNSNNNNKGKSSLMMMYDRISKIMTSSSNANNNVAVKRMKRKTISVLIDRIESNLKISEISKNQKNQYESIKHYDEKTELFNNLTKSNSLYTTVQTIEKSNMTRMSKRQVNDFIGLKGIKSNKLHQGSNIANDDDKLSQTQPTKSIFITTTSNGELNNLNYYDTTNIRNISNDSSMPNFAYLKLEMPSNNYHLENYDNIVYSAMELECIAGYDGGLPQEFFLEAYDSRTKKLRLNVTSTYPDIPLFRIDISG